MAINVGTAVAYLELDTSKFSSGFKSALSDLNTFADSTSSVNKKMQSLSSAFGNVGSTLTKGVTTPLATLGTAGVKASADFGSAMSQVAATMGTTTDKIQDLSTFAKQMGATTAFSATEAADGLNILAMSGLDASEQMAALPNVLNLAAAGQISMGNAASYVTTAVKGFGDSMENSQYYVDLMAKGATLANTDVNMLGAALSSSSAISKSFGQSAESTTKSLLRMAEMNITGEEAATALRRAMMDLYTPTTSAKKALDELGVSAYDSAGNTRDFNELVDDLNNALSGMSDEQRKAYENTIFTTYGMTAFDNMVSVTTDKLADFDEGLRTASDEMDGQGSAAAQAKTQLDNLKGSIILMKSALEGVLISIGDRLSPYIRKAVDKLTELLTAFNKLSEEEKDQIVKFGLIAAAIGPILILISKLIKSATTAVTAFNKISTIGKMFSGLSSPIISITIVLGLLAAAFVKSWKSSEDFRNKVTNALNSVKARFGDFKNTLNVFRTKVMDTFTDLSNRFDTFRKSFVNKLNGFGYNFENVGDVIYKAWTFIADVIASPILDNALALVSKQFSNILGVINDLTDIIGAAFSGDWDTVKTGLVNLTKQVYSTFQELPRTIINLIGDLGSNILRAFGLDAVADNFKAFTDEVGKAFDSISNIIGEVLGESVQTLLGVLSDAAGKVSELLQDFNELSDEQKEKIVKFGLAAAVIVKLLPVLKRVASGVELVFSAFGKLKGVVSIFTSISAPMAGVIAVIMAVAGAFIYLWNTSEDFRNKVKDIVDDIQDKFESFKNDLSDKLSEIGLTIDDVKNGIKAAWDFIANVIMSPIILDALQLVSDTFGDVLDVILDFADVVVSALNGDWDGVKEGLGNMVEDIYKTFQELPEALLGLIGDLGANILNALGLDDTAEVWQGFFDGLQEALSFINDFVGNVLKVTFEVFLDGVAGAFDILGVIFETIKNFAEGIEGIFEAIENGNIGGFFENLFNMIGNGLALIPELFSSILSTIGDIGNTLLSALGFEEAGQKFEEFFDFLSSIFGNFGEFMQNLGTNLGTFFTQIVPDIFNTVTSFLGEQISEIGDTISGFFTETIPGIWSSFKSSVSNKFNELTSSIVEWGSSLKEKVMGKFNSIVDSIKSIDLFDAGSKIMKSLWNGLKSMWNSVKDWFGGLFDNVFDVFTGSSSDTGSLRAATLSIDGSHRNGLSYVPWDGYTARLHKGERVLTKEQNEEYNKGNGSSGGDTFVFYNTKPDPYEYSRQMKRSKRELSHNL